MGLFDFLTSEKEKDFKAAEADFLEILKLREIPDTKEQLVIFSKNFYLSYGIATRTLQRTQRVSKPTSETRRSFTYNVIENLDTAAHLLYGTNNSDIGENIGQSLGYLVATIDNGLLGKYFDPYSLEEETRTIGRKIDDYMKKIHSLDKRIYLGNIALRVWKLSENRKKNRRYNLSPSFISEINSALSSHYS